MPAPDRGKPDSSDLSGSSAGRNGGIMVVAITIGRILGLLRDTVLSSHFGIRLEGDAYRIAFQVPDTIFMLVAGGGLSSAFMPVFSDFYHRGKKKEAWDAFGAVVTFAAIAAISLIVVAWIFTPQIVGFFSAGKDPQDLPYLLSTATRMSRILLPGQFAFLIGSIMIATLYVRKQFWVGSLAPNIYNLCIVLGGMLLPATLGLGVESMAWGALAGAMVGNLILPSFAMLRNGSRFKPSLDLSTPGLSAFFRLLLPVVIGFSLPSMVGMISIKFGSEYGREGVNTALGLANNLMQAPVGIFGQGLAIGAFPVLAQFVATSRMDLYRAQLSKTLRTVLYLSLPSGALLLAVAPQIVHCLYGHGKASSDLANQTAISDCLRIYALGIFLWCMQPVLMRGFFSLHKTFKPIAISTAMTGMFIWLCVVAIHVSQDFRWVPAACDVSILILAGTLYIALEKDVGKLDRAGILTTILLCGAASAVAAGAAFAMVQILHPRSMFFQILFLLGVGTASAWIYYFVTRWMKVPETEYVDRMLARAQGLFRR